MVLHLAAAVLSGSGSPACSLRPAEPDAMDPALPPPRPSSPRPQGTSGASSCVDERLEDAFKKLRGLRDGGLLSPNSYLTLCKDALHQSVEASLSASRSRLSDGSGGASSVAWRPLSRIHAGGPSAQAPTPPAPTPVERTALDVSFADSPVRNPLPPEDMIEGYEGEVFAFEGWGFIADRRSAQIVLRHARIYRFCLLLIASDWFCTRRIASDRFCLLLNASGFQGVSLVLLLIGSGCVCLRPTLFVFALLCFWLLLVAFVCVSCCMAYVRIASDRFWLLPTAGCCFRPLLTAPVCNRRCFCLVSYASGRFWLLLFASCALWLISA